MVVGTDMQTHLTHFNLVQNALKLSMLRPLTKPDRRSKTE